MTIRAILFDHDGTLVDSEGEHFAMWLEILADFDVVLSLQQYKQFYAGLPTETNAARLVSEFGLTINAAELSALKNQVTTEFLSHSAFPLITGVRRSVIDLFNRGYQLGVVTGAGNDSLKNTLHVHELDQYFSSTVSKDDVRISKPAPECYQLALSQLGLTPAEAIAIEDTEHGVSAATAAGITCLAIPTVLSLHHDFSAAERVFTDIESAGDWIVSQQPA